MHRKRTVACFTFALFLQGCRSSDEVSRVTNPSGAIDAVLVERNGGATSTFSYDVHVVPRGMKPAGRSRVAVLVGATRSETAYGANLVWRGPTLLGIEFLRAARAELEEAAVDVAGARVVIALREGVRDPSAPAGGMLRNLKRP
jgi:hypothetical protein